MTLSQNAVKIFISCHIVLLTNIIMHVYSMHFFIYCLVAIQQSPKVYRLISFSLQLFSFSSLLVRKAILFVLDFSENITDYHESTSMENVFHHLKTCMVSFCECWTTMHYER